MEQHPIPRQITTFEFKLIGFMTLKQFLYLIAFIPIGLLLFRLIPIPIVNVLIGFLTGLTGVLLAFFPINDRPMDVFIKNLIRRLTSPTQFIYQKENKPLYFLSNLFFSSDPHKTFAFIDSQEKLSQYLTSKGGQTISAQRIQQRQSVNQALLDPQKGRSTNATPLTVPKVDLEIIHQAAKEPTQPLLIGVVKNNKETPLPEILVYLKDERGNPVRLFKTNPHGVFATYHAVPGGEYMVEAKDPRGAYFFDTIKVRLGDSNPTPLEVVSKRVL